MMNDKNLGSQKNKLKEIKRTPELRFKGFSDDWEQRKLSDLMTFSNGINAPKENYGTGTKMISVMDILNPLPMKYDNILNSVAVDKKIEDKNKVEKGDLMFVLQRLLKKLDGQKLIKKITTLCIVVLLLEENESVLIMRILLN
ncbi:hypothetical protein LMJ99_07230 [Lactococcus garvieae subsp. garvieae]|nr:hypothetical protein LMJ99_07230 [Lactococcus garvieae subsp. garvieae]